MRTGIVLTIIGIWLIARTVKQDDNGDTLVDRILGDTKAKSSSSTKTPAKKAPAKAVTPPVLKRRGTRVTATPALGTYINTAPPISATPPPPSLEDQIADATSIF